MIEIAPAILTNSKKEFTEQLGAYSKIFKFIDIDINIAGDGFSGEETVAIEYVVEKIKKLDLDNDFTFHLMVEYPDELVTFIKSNIQNANILIHQEYYENYALNEQIGIVINPKDRMKSLEFYNGFSEVQFMTVTPGIQGNPFQEEVMDRVEWLKNSGFQGKISIDGSVNLSTAKIISKYSIDKVSVGSYFSKSGNLEEDFKALNQELNNV